MAVDFAIVLVAAGSSTRMGFPKLWTELDGRPLLAHAIADAGASDRSSLSWSPRIALPRPLISRRQPAWYAAARVVATRWRPAWRQRPSTGSPFTMPRAPWRQPRSTCVAWRLHRRAARAIPVVPLKDTVKRIDNGRVAETIARAEHVAVQTPQVFRRDLLQQALSTTDEDVTDEAALVERMGIAVATFAGHELAFKVTTPLDLAVARAIVSF